MIRERNQIQQDIDSVKQLVKYARQEQDCQEEEALLEVLDQLCEELAQSVFNN